MSFEVVDGLLTLKLSLVGTTALAAVLLLFGNLVRQKVPFFVRFCIPAPVIGGFSFSLLAWLLRSSGILGFSLDTTLQMPLMIAFFTTVGLEGSLGLIKKGGKSLLIYLVGCWILAIAQNVIGAGTAKLTGIHPVLGIMAGAVSLEGGMGAASAFGPTVEEMGVQGAFVVAVASATYGLISGGLFGGPLAKWLIERYRLEIKTDETENISYDVEKKDTESVTSSSIINMAVLILVIMVLGEVIAGYIKTATGFVLPGYIGAMFVAILFRNLNDSFNFVKVKWQSIDVIADFSLGMFLSMAMMSLKIWELASLALPLIIILAVQTIFIFAYCIFLLFPALGRNYDAAVMCAGMIGHGLGATPNAIANMNAVCERYGVVSKKAFLIVPLCGAVLIDLVGIPNIVWFINYLVK
jgi:ESS family glutamate:Na+ symporter